MLRRACSRPRSGDDGRFVDGAILISPGLPYQADGDVVAVDV